MRRSQPKAVRGTAFIAAQLRRVSVACVLALAAVAVTSTAVAQTVYNSIPSPLPPNVASEGPEAYAFIELGDGFTLTGTGKLGLVTVIMSSWGCQTGRWSFANCVTAPGATFNQTVTFNVYSVTGVTPGPLLATLTQTFNMPYRPSSDNVDCPGGEWYDAALGICKNGIAFPISMDFTSANVTVPQHIIVTVAYNTTDWGPHPIGAGAACFASSGGCPYDSLNISTDTTNGTFHFIGAPVDPNGIFVSYANNANACTPGPLDVLRDDSGCWAGLHPEIQVNLAAFGPATAQDGPVQVHYFIDPSPGDSYINITNDGFNGDDLSGPGSGYFGDICANVFVFDATDEQEIACCSCVISPNAVVSLKLSVLTSNLLTGVPPTSTTVKLVATQPTVGGIATGTGSPTLTGCSGSAATVDSLGTTLVNGMLAWGTTLALAPAAGTYATVQSPFLPVSLTIGAPATNTELASLANRCLNIGGNASTYGQCSGCTVGALGAAKM